jgi:hypothetical protein
VHRRLTERAQAEAEAERDGRQRVADALAEQRAVAQQAEARATAAEGRANELVELELELSQAGVIRAWRLARTLRRRTREDIESPMTATPS